MATFIYESDWQMHKGVIERNKHMLDNELATDITFKVSATPKDEPKIIKAHKYMLISASPVFWSMFYGELREYDDVIVCNVDAEAFSIMLSFVYTEKALFSGNNVMHVLNAAKKYQLPSLANLCTGFLDKQLDASNACSVLEHSRFFNEEGLMKKCIDIIESHAASVLQSDDFLEISQETLSTILDSDYLQIKEIDVFDSCIKWAERRSDGVTIRETLGDSLYRIQFPAMSSSEFSDRVSTKNILTSEEELEVYRYMSSAVKSVEPTHFPFESRQPRNQQVTSSSKPLTPGTKVRFMINFNMVNGTICSYQIKEDTYMVKNDRGFTFSRKRHEMTGY